MDIKRLHHIAVAVRDIEQAMGTYADVLGMPRTEVVSLEVQQVKATLIPIGDCEIELIEPVDRNGSVAKFIERRSEALHHICFQVPDVDKALAELEGRGLQLIDRQARPGLAGLIGFIHPRSTRGVLTELCTPRDEPQ